MAKNAKHPRCYPSPRASVLRRRRPLACPTQRPTMRCLNEAGRKPAKRSSYAAPRLGWLVGDPACQRAGLRVVGSAGTLKGLQLVRAEGAYHAVNHTEEGYMNEVRRRTGAKRPELILANVNLAADMELAAKYGRIIVIGNRGEITVNPRVAMMKELDICGVALWNATAAQMKSIMLDILAGVAEGSLRPVVGREMRLSEAAAAQVAVLGHGVGGKIVLIP